MLVGALRSGREFVVIGGLSSFICLFSLGWMHTRTAYHDMKVETLEFLFPHPFLHAAMHAVRSNEIQ